MHWPGRLEFERKSCAVLVHFIFAETLRYCCLTIAETERINDSVLREVLCKPQCCKSRRASEPRRKG